MKFVADHGESDYVSMPVRVKRSVREGLDDLCSDLGWSRERLVNEIFERVIPCIEVVSDPSEGLDK